MGLQAKKLRFAGLTDNFSSFLIAATFGLLIVNCVFFDKGYYDTMPQDLFGFLDGIYRTHLGQVPHRDFSTVEGAIQFLVPSFFVDLGANLVSSVRYYHVILLLLAMCIVIYIQRTRLENVVSISFGAVVGLALACKYNFGGSPFEITEAMLYNRIGFVFLTLELALFINPAIKRTAINVDQLLYVDAALTGLICGFLFYVKFTFGLAALGFAFFNLLADDRTWRSTIILLSGALVVLLLFVIIIEFGYGGGFALYRDVRMAMLSDSGGKMRIIFHRLIVDAPEIIIAVVLPLLIIRFSGVKIIIYWVLYALVIILSSITLQIYSAQESVLFLPLAFILFAMSKLQSDNNTNEYDDRIPYFLVMIFVSILAIANLAYPMLINVMLSSTRYYYSGPQPESGNSLLNTIRTTSLRAEADHAGKLLSPHAVEMVKSEPPLDAYMLARTSRPPYPWDNLSFPEYKFYLSDGLNAATSGCLKGARIATLDFVNPFPALLGWPEGGGMVFVDQPWLVSETHHLSAAEMFRQIDCVLVPKAQMLTGLREFFRRVYGEYLDAKYAKTTETALWTVLAAKPEE